VTEARSTNEAMIRQIQQAWDEAQAQLGLLREQVEHAAALAQSKVRSNALESELDRAYRDLGEAVWAEVSKGKLQLPGQLGPVKKALHAVTAKIQTQKSSISDLLSEGADVARRLQEKATRTSKAVANAPKKR
jgi:hypothetical protein